MLSSLPEYDADVFGPIHSLPTFTSDAENEESIRFILRVIGGITAVNLALLLLMKYMFNSTGKAAWKASYQVTNLLTNATLGLYGIHVHLGLDSNETLQDKIHGYPHMKSFALGQMGYQLWAIPVGVLFVDETASMLVHHVAVICVASTSAFLTSGFRYYNPVSRLLGRLSCSSVFSLLFSRGAVLLRTDRDIFRAAQHNELLQEQQGLDQKISQSVQPGENHLRGILPYCQGVFVDAVLP